MTLNSHSRVRTGDLFEENNARDNNSISNRNYRGYNADILRGLIEGLIGSSIGTMCKKNRYLLDKLVKKWKRII
jgi:hypothetical protein